MGSISSHLKDAISFSWSMEILDSECACQGEELCACSHKHVGTKSQWSLLTVSCTWFSHWNLVCRSYTDSGILVKQISGVKSLKTPRFEPFPQCVPTAKWMQWDRALLQWAQSGRWADLGEYNVLPLACRAQWALTQALLSVKGPCQSPWQQTSRIPLDYWNIWTNLNINLRLLHNHFFPSEMERQGRWSDCSEKCDWAEAKIKRPHTSLHPSLGNWFSAVVLAPTHKCISLFPSSTLPQLSH